jgi:hypothetical protein
VLRTRRDIGVRELHYPQITQIRSLPVSMSGEV